MPKNNDPDFEGPWCDPVFDKRAKALADYDRATALAMKSVQFSQTTQTPVLVMGFTGALLFLFGNRHPLLLTVMFSSLAYVICSVVWIFGLQIYLHHNRARTERIFAEDRRD